MGKDLFDMRYVYFKYAWASQCRHVMSCGRMQNTSETTWLFCLAQMCLPISGEVVTQIIEDSIITEADKPVA